MGTFYIKHKNQPMEIIQDDSALLCETTNTFIYPGGGFRSLLKIIDDKPEMLESLEIFDDTKKYYTVNQFLKKIEKLKLATFNK